MRVNAKGELLIVVVGWKNWVGTIGGIPYCKHTLKDQSEKPNALCRVENVEKID